MSKIVFMEDIVGLNEAGQVCHPYKQKVNGVPDSYSYSFESHNRGFKPASAQELIAMVERGEFTHRGKIRMLPRGSTRVKKNGAMRVVSYKGVTLAPGSASADVEEAKALQSKFWWVNHKQTHRDEYAGGYIWSPKTKKNNVANEGYLNLTRVIPGDRIFSYASGVIKAIGVATHSHVEALIPQTHSDAADWEEAGWKVAVEWMPLETPLRPKEYLERIVPLLPAKHSPIQKNGDGNQGCYLAAISQDLGRLLLDLASNLDTSFVQLVHEIDVEAADVFEEEILQSSEIPETEKVQLVRSRVGQGLFRLRVAQQEKSCRLTRVNNLAFLVASHIKPWRVCDNKERLDGNNGLLLSPHVDKLFDRGWISFSDDGQVLISEGAKSVVDAWRLDQASPVGAFSAKQRVYLKFHRENIFKNAGLRPEDPPRRYNREPRDRRTD